VAGPDDAELKELEEFMLARAVEHDSPTLLLRASHPQDWS
jgi:hypothetical protein